MQSKTLILFVLSATLSPSLGASINTPVHITIQDPTSTSDVEVTGNADDTIRIKRSGSGSPDFFSYIKRGITGKISQIAQASAGASAHFSRGSSGGGGGDGYHYPAPHDTPISYGTKSFDFWSLKKSILNTLLQAVKAINGGIIAIKGQLIKGSGAIISAKGKIISMKGDAITNLGKHIVSNANLSPTAYHSKPVSEYSSPSGHSGPTSIAHPSPSYGPPPVEYGPPSSPSSPSIGPSSPGFSNRPSSTYGAPTAPGYGAPTAPGYGAPTASVYGPPIGPSASSVPSQAYLPQKVNTNSHYEEYKSKPTAQAGIIILKKIPKNQDIPSGIAALPLQDERNKVVKPTITPLFSPEPPSAPPTSPYKDTYNSNSFFESSLDTFSPPKPLIGSPIDAPPSASSAPVAPTAPNSLNSPAYVDDHPKYNTPPFADVGSYFSKFPGPFEINSFENLPSPNFPLNNVQPSHSSYPAPFKTDFIGGLNAPSFNLGPSNSYPLSSNLQYKAGIFEQKQLPTYDVVKSVSYELPNIKRH